MENDLISRQAAIDAVLDRMNVEKYGRNAKPEEIQWALEKLPSAQPEQRWIPCSERLPEKNCRCLTTNTALGAFEVDFNVWINGEWLYPNKKPIAWMPLPEPYKEEEQNG